jgi:hypothetical protein
VRHHRRRCGRSSNRPLGAQRMTSARGTTR